MERSCDEQCRFHINDIGTGIQINSYDEIDAETMLDVLRCEQKGYDSITEGLEEVLDKYFQKYGFEYAIRPDFLGTECINVELSGTEGEKIDEIEVKTGE